MKYAYEYISVIVVHPLVDDKSQISLFEPDRRLLHRWCEFLLVIVSSCNKYQKSFISMRISDIYIYISKEPMMRFSNINICNGLFVNMYYILFNHIYSMQYNYFIYKRKWKYSTSIKDHSCINERISDIYIKGTND